MSQNIQTQRNPPAAASIEAPHMLPSPLPGTLVLDRKAKVGAYSDVWKGIWTDVEEKERVVCIKCVRNTAPVTDVNCNLNPNERFDRRVLRETIIWKRTSHPNVLPFLGHQVVKGDPWLISPWMEQGSLAAYLLANPDVSSTKKLQLLQQASKGLKYLHDLDPPIAHGDLKPENIVINDDGVAALCDMGVSRILQEGHTGLTTSGSAPGSAGFQAKELIMGESLPTAQSDIYAMGGVILETLTGKKPFYKAPTYVVVMLNIQADKIPAPEDHLDLPREDRLWPFLRRCWSPSPARRPTASDVIEELKHSIEEHRLQLGNF